MVKHIATPRRHIVVALIAALSAALATAGCGVKGPLVPAPRPAAATPPQTPPTISEEPPAERKP
ncbi:MAG: lipoprotein [Casimicrobiaceae bacterium]